MQWGQPWGTGSLWGAIASATADFIVQRAENEILTGWPAFWGDPGFAPENWELSVPTGVSVPVVILAEAGGDASEVLLTVDQPLETGLTYTVTPLGALGGTVPSAGTVLAKLVTTTQQPGLDLLDLDAGPFEPYRLTPGGDHGMAAGFATFRKLVIDRLLTVRGSVPWDPDHGSQLDHKSPRPLDGAGEAARIEALLATVPGMLSVGVELGWDGQQRTVDLDARGETGVLQETVKLPKR